MRSSMSVLRRLARPAAFIAAARRSVPRSAVTSSFARPLSTLVNRSQGIVGLKAAQFARCYADVVVKVPSMGDSISSGTIQQWNKNVGDFVKADEVIGHIETDKVVVDVTAPESGTITAFLAEPDQEVEVGQELVKLEPGSAPAGGASQESKKEEKQEEKAEEKKEEDKKEEKKEEKAESKSDEKKEAKKEEKKEQKAPSASSSGKSQPAPAPVQFNSREEKREKMSKMRQRIAQRLKDSQNVAAMLTTFNEIDMTNIMALRNKYKEDFQKSHGIKLGFMSAFLKASTSALQTMPIVNAYIDGNEIVHRNFVDISVAVASPTGLVVPVVRNCDKMNMADIEKEIGRLADLAKNGKISIEDMAGGTFTVSNGGVFGSLMGTPIINPPQSAILGMHATKMRPVVTESGAVEARPMMYVALTYDHRLIDGREAVTFLRRVKDVVEDPSRLLLGL